MIRYYGCGLDNVYLRNGYKLSKTESGKETLFIENVSELHRALAAWVCDLPRPLTPKEFKFLRVMLGLTQRQLGDLVHVEDQTVSTWERDKHPISEFGDFAVRALMKERISGSLVFEEFLKNLAKQESDKRWEDDAACVEFEAMPHWRRRAAA
jgi:putative transcriptional regulator